MKKIFKNIKTKIIATSLAVATLIPIVSVNTITHAANDETYIHTLTTHRIETIMGRVTNHNEKINVLVMNFDDESNLTNSLLTDLTWMTLGSVVIKKNGIHYTNSVIPIINTIFNNEAKTLFSAYNINYCTDDGFLSIIKRSPESISDSIGNLKLMNKYSTDNPLSIYNMPDENLLLIMREYLFSRYKQTNDNVTDNILIAIDSYISDKYYNKDATYQAKIRNILCYIMNAGDYKNKGYNWNSKTRKYWDHL